MSNRTKGAAFEYRAMRWLKERDSVIEVIRSGASHSIDFTVIRREGREHKISKEEAKSSLSYLKRRDKNPLSLLGKDDVGKMADARRNGFGTFLLYREPKLTANGKRMRATKVARVEVV